jgi:hypothetical protein
MSSSNLDQTALMKEVLDALRVLQENQTRLASNVDAITGRVNILAGIKEVQDAASTDQRQNKGQLSQTKSHAEESHDHVDVTESHIPESPSIVAADLAHDSKNTPVSASHIKSPTVTSRIILT